MGRNNPRLSVFGRRVILAHQSVNLDIRGKPAHDDTSQRCPGALEQEVSAEEIRAALARILASNTFANAPTLSRLLKHLVEQTIDGAADQLKESLAWRGCVRPRTGVRSAHRHDRPGAGQAPARKAEGLLLGAGAVRSCADRGTRPAATLLYSQRDQHERT